MLEQNKTCKDLERLQKLETLPEVIVLRLIFVALPSMVSILTLTLILYLDTVYPKKENNTKNVFENFIFLVVNKQKSS